MDGAETPQHHLVPYHPSSQEVQAWYAGKPSSQRPSMWDPRNPVAQAMGEDRCRWIEQQRRDRAANAAPSGRKCSSSNSCASCRRLFEQLAQLTAEVDALKKENAELKAQGKAASGFASSWKKAFAIHQKQQKQQQKQKQKKKQGSSSSSKKKLPTTLLSRKLKRKGAACRRK